MYLNTTKSEDLDGDGKARFDEAGTGLREITDLTQGVKSASSPKVNGETRRISMKMVKVLEKLSFHLKNLSDKDDEIKQQLLQVGYQDGNIKMWSYTLEITQTDTGTGNKEVSDIKENTRKEINLEKITKQAKMTTTI